MIIILGVNKALKNNSSTEISLLVKKKLSSYFSIDTSLTICTDGGAKRLRVLLTYSLPGVEMSMHS